MENQTPLKLVEVRLKSNSKFTKKFETIPSVINS